MTLNCGAHGALAKAVCYTPKILSDSSYYIAFEQKEICVTGCFSICEFFRENARQEKIHNR